jgi:hypothetical protein
MYTPDLWAIVKVTTGDEINFRVLGSWYGGYLGGDSWRMSSGIVDYDDHEDHYAFFNHSGSVYVCSKSAVGLSSMAYMALDNLQSTYQQSRQSNDTELRLEVIDVDTFFKLFKGDRDETESSPST